MEKIGLSWLYLLSIFFSVPTTSSNLNFQAVIKPQYVDNLPKSVCGSVGKLLEESDEKGIMAEICQELELNTVLDHEIKNLSGGELQRFAIARTAVKNADIYMFDEPSCYLDVKQRLKAAKVIRSLLRPNRYSLNFLIIVCLAVLYIYCHFCNHHFSHLFLS